MVIRHRWKLPPGTVNMAITSSCFQTTTFLPALMDSMRRLEPMRFLLVRGEEVTDEFKGKSVHNSSVSAKAGSPLREEPASLIRCRRMSMRSAKPEAFPTSIIRIFQWSITTDDLIRLRMTGYSRSIMAIRKSITSEAVVFPALEEIWDAILSSGKLMHGIAVDDAHHFKRPLDARASKPGKGGSMFEPQTGCCRTDGCFWKKAIYASTGVELSARSSSGRLYLR